MTNFNTNNTKRVFEAGGEKKPLRYSEECLTRTAEGKRVKVTLVNGTVISGVLKVVSMYDLRINDGTKEVIIFKSAIATVEVS